MAKQPRVGLYVRPDTRELLNKLRLELSLHDSSYQVRSQDATIRYLIDFYQGERRRPAARQEAAHA